LVAIIVARDARNLRAKEISRSADALVTTDHVVVETWLLLTSRYRREAAEVFWNGCNGASSKLKW
jgi:predicted nucleic acid-binding protein